QNGIVNDIRTGRAFRLVLWNSRYGLSSTHALPADLVARTADGDLIVSAKLSFLNPDAVDADAVGAAKIANDQIVLNLRNATMAARDLARVDLNIALGMTAQEKNGLVEQDVGAFSQGHKLCRHISNPPVA